MWYVRLWALLAILVLLVPGVQASGHHLVNEPLTSPTLNISTSNYRVEVGSPVQFNGTSTGGSATIGVVNTIGVGTYPFGIAYDPVKQEMFVTNDQSNNVSVINDATGRVVANINTGTAPDYAAYDSAKNDVWIANCGSDNVSIINPTTNRVQATVSVGSCPSGIAYDYGKGEMFVADNGNEGGENVSVINDTTNTVVASISPSAWALDRVGVLTDAYDPGTGEIFVSLNSAGAVGVISDVSNTLTTTVTVGNGPAGLVYDHGDIYVANFGDGTVKTISDATNAVTNTITVGSEPYAMGYVPTKGQVFAMNSGAGTVSIINDTTFSVVQTVSVEANPAWCAYDSARGQVYVANGESNTVSVIQYGWSFAYQFGDGNASYIRNPVHTYTVPGNYHVWAWFNSTAADVHSELNLTIYRGGGKPPPSSTMIYGFVDNQSQDPLQGAVVNTNWGNLSWANNTQGYYSLILQTSYKYANVCANASGYAYQCYNATLTGAGIPLNFYLSPANATQAMIQGTVKACGTSLSNVLVQLYLGSNETNSTLGDGSYSLGLVTPVAEYEIKASKSGYATVYTNVSTNGLANYLNLTLAPNGGCSSNGGGGGAVVFNWLVVNESYLLLLVLLILALMVAAALYRRLRE